VLLVQTLPDRRLGRPVAARRGFVHDRHARSAVAILCVERAAGQDRDPHDLEVAGTNPVETEARDLLRREDVVFGRERHPHAAESQRHPRG
jgi:hypothetical protein